MTDQQKKAVEEAAISFADKGIYHTMYDSKIRGFKSGAEEVLNSPEKYGLVTFDDYKKVVKERKQANEDHITERKENARLREALYVTHASLCTYGKHPIIDEQVSKALKVATPCK